MFTPALQQHNFFPLIDDYAKDGVEELFTEMQCVLITNP